MKFNLLVTEGPYTHQASDTAFHFAKAAIDSGHEVVRVFFYHDGVHNATRLSFPPADDRNVIDRWIRLADGHGVDLAVCIAASLRRGVLNENSARQNSAMMANLDSHFKVAGFGYFIEGSMIADRTLVFGD